MRNKSYIIKRDEVCIGKVVKIDKNKEFEESDGNVEVFHLQGGKLSIDQKFPLQDMRSMLFVPTKDLSLANDLLYQGSNYPILNMTDKDVSLDYVSNNGGYVVDQAYNISKLLEIFDYQSWLTHKDVKEIRKIFFSGRFAVEHSALFGYEQPFPESFTYVGDGALPKELFDILDDMGDNGLLDVIFDGAKKNVFKPNKVEGAIKKLSIL